MTALWIVGILLLILLAVQCSRVGVQIAFGEETRVVARLGFIRLQIMPQKERQIPKKQKEKPKKEKKKIEQLEKDLPIEGKYKDKKVMIKQYLGDGYYTLVYSTEMIDKINELVDAVNLLLDKSTES